MSAVLTGSETPVTICDEPGHVRLRQEGLRGSRGLPGGPAARLAREIGRRRRRPGGGRLGERDRRALRRPVRRRGRRGRTGPPQGTSTGPGGSTRCSPTSPRAHDRRTTYSIVARDPDTGELGVAVQSHWFSVGSIVAWARAGVGAVATQSVAEPAYGPRLLERLAAGELPGDALRAELAADEEAEFRQVAVVDGEGRVAVHTGAALHRRRPARAPARVQRPGEHDGRGRCLAGDGGRLRGGGRPARAPSFAALEAAERRAATFAGASRPRSSSSGPRGSRGRPAGPSGRGPGRAVARVVPAARPARRLRARGSGRLARRRRRARRGGAPLRRAAEAAPGSAELAFWAGLGLAAAGDLDRGAERVANPSAPTIGGAYYFERLDSGLAPSAARPCATTSASNRATSNEQRFRSPSPTSRLRTSPPSRRAPALGSA